MAWTWSNNSLHTCLPELAKEQKMTSYDWVDMWDAIVNLSNAHVLPQTPFFCLYFITYQFSLHSHFHIRTVAKKMRLVTIRAPNAVAIGHSLNLKGSTDSSGKKHWLSIYKVFVMLKIKGQQCLFLKLFFV